MLKAAIITSKDPEDPQPKMSILPRQDAEKIMAIDHVKLAWEFAT